MGIITMPITTGGISRVRVSKRNITRKISAGWQKKTRSEKEQWADWEWAQAEMKRLVGMRCVSCPYKSRLVFGLVG